MDDECVEFFCGTAQENEKERKWKGALMCILPSFFRTGDTTRYVVVGEDKPKQESETFATAAAVPTNNGPNPNIFRIGELQSLQPKKGDGQQTAVQSITNWGNKENAGTVVPKSPSGFDTKDASNPFKLNALYRNFDAAYGNKPRTTTVRNDSLELEKDKIENIAGSLKTVSVNNNTNTVSNNAATTKPYIKPGLYGGDPSRDYTEDLRTVKQGLPPVALNILNDSGIEIIVLDNLQSVTKDGKIIKRNGRYFADKNKIYLDSKKVDEYTLISELFHAVQDHLGMTDIGKSNLEFQEHVIKDLYFGQKFRKTGDYKYFEGISTTDDDGYVNLINNGFDNNGILYLNNFLMYINSYFDKFQDYYLPSGMYQEPGIENYDYKWKDLLDLFGIEYK